MEIYCIPNDDGAFSICQLNGHSVKITVHNFKGLAYIDVMVDGEVLMSGQRAMNNQWILPSYKNDIIGNLRFEAHKPDSLEYVTIDNINTVFKLHNYSPDELKELESP